MLFVEKLQFELELFFVVMDFFADEGVCLKSLKRLGALS